MKHVKCRSTASLRLSAYIPGYRHTGQCPGLLTTYLSSKLEGNCPLRHSASRTPNINRCIPDIWPWLLPFTLTFDLGRNLWPWHQSRVKGKKQWCPKTIFSIWPWPLTKDLDLKSQPSLHQGLQSTTMPNITVKAQTGLARRAWTNRDTHKWMLWSALSRCKHKSPYGAGLWQFPDVWHSQDVELIA